MKRWYALYTKVHEEVWAGNNLRQRGLEIYLPRFAKRRRHARKVEIVKAPLFPRYLFARADVDLGQRPTMAYAQGVEYVVGFGRRLAVVADHLIDELRAREDDGGLISMAAHPAFRRGQKIRISEGALLDNTGLFESSSDARVFVLLNLLGGQVRTSLPISAITDDS
jgi:transcriptional antiterminator RfaH